MSLKPELSRGSIDDSELTIKRKLSPSEMSASPRDEFNAIKLNSRCPLITRLIKDKSDEVVILHKRRINKEATTSKTAVCGTKISWNSIPIFLEEVDDFKEVARQEIRRTPNLFLKDEGALMIAKQQSSRVQRETGSYVCLLMHPL